MKFLISNLKLLVRNFRTVTLINIAGLAMAFAVAVVVSSQTWYDLSYDRGYENSDEIFFAELSFKDDPNGDVWETFAQQLAAAIKDITPEIESYALLNWANDEARFRTEHEAEGAPEFILTTQEVSTGFMDVFTPTIVEGDVSRALTEPGRGMISRKNAERIFGTASAVGQILVSGEATYTIDAVYEDFPKNSSVTNGLLTYMKPNRPNNYNYKTYFRFDPANYDAVVEKANTLDMPVQEDGYKPYEGMTFHFTNLARHHLHGSAGGSGRFDTTLYMLVMGVIILAVAFINFINLFMSMAPARVRKINTFRILGSGRTALRLSLALESVIILAVAMVIGTGLVEWFSGSVFTEFFSADISPEANVPVIVLLAFVLAAAAFVMALWPARYATSFDVAVALKGSMVLAPRGVMLRNALITLQFAVAIFFICFATFIRVQYNYMERYSLGFQKENIVMVPMLPDSLSRASFEQELRRNPDVADITWSASPGNLGTQWGRDFEGKKVQVALWPATNNMLDFFGVRMVAGSGFSPEITSREQVIVNQKFLDTYGFTAEDVIGKTFETYRQDGLVVGVSEDVNFESLHNEVRPMVFVAMNTWNNQGLVKIAGGDTPATLRHIEETWNRFKPKNVEFSFEFLDAQLDARYKSELNMSRLIGILGLIAVVTAVMGVYVIILFNSRYKTREIAIRKVNGARIGEIALGLNRGMLIALGVATALALAPTLWFILGWVSSFAYKADVPWWLYPGAVLVVLIIATATVSWQSWRAATANPVNSLKSE